LIKITNYNNNIQQPTTNNQQPTTNYQQPTTNNQQNSEVLLKNRFDRAVRYSNDFIVGLLEIANQFYQV